MHGIQRKKIDLERVGGNDDRTDRSEVRSRRAERLCGAAGGGVDGGVWSEAERKEEKVVMESRTSVSASAHLRAYVEVSLNESSSVGRAKSQRTSRVALFSASVTQDGTGESGVFCE